MSTTTNKLKLFKYDPVADANSTFNITNALNNNFDNIESKTGLFIYDNTATYALGDWVLGVVNNERKIFESLANSNTGNALTDTTKWEEVSFGAKTDLSNVTNTSGFRKLVEVYVNGASWYKVFREYDPSTGNLVGLWCEQGATQTVNNTYNAPVVFIKAYKDTNYTVTANILTTTWGGSSARADDDTVAAYSAMISTKTTTGFSFAYGYYQGDPYSFMWVAQGYIS